MNNFWKPPFCLHQANYGEASDKSYYFDVMRREDPPCILIKHTLSGVGVLYVKKKKLLVKPGMIFVIERPGPYIYCYEGDGKPWEFEFVSISFTNPSGLLPQSLRNNPVFSLEGHDDLKKQLEELISLRTRKDYTLELIHSAKAYQFFLSYITIRLKGSAPPAVAQKLKIYIEKNFLENFSISEYSKKAGYSKEALIRLFSKTYGMPPGKYIVSLRLKEACSLLEERKLNIKEVAHKTGFASQNYFARTFKKHMHQSPKTYQKTPAPLKTVSSVF